MLWIVPCLLAQLSPPPRPIETGLRLIADAGTINELSPISARGSRTKIAVSASSQAVWYDHVYVPAVTKVGVCNEYPDAQPQPGTFENFVAGTITLPEFMALNPLIWLGYEVQTGWYWTNARRECEAGRFDPPIHITSPPYYIKYKRIDFWAGVGCEGIPVVVSCNRGASISWSYTDGNRQYPECGMLLNTVWVGSTPSFSPCDANFDGVSDLVDWGIFTQAGYWDWNNDGLVNATDVAGFQACLLP